MTVKLYPSTDVHLLRGMSVTFDLLRNFNEQPLNDWNWQSGFDFDLPAAVSLATMTGLTLTASTSATGSKRTSLIMRSPAGGAPVLSLPVRISVHRAIHRLWCSTADLQLETQRSDRVLVVYAEFEDATGARIIVDVTGRDFLAYPVAGTAGLTVGSDGRVTTTAATGTWVVTIDVATGVPGLSVTPLTGSVTIQVTAPSADLAILRQHHNGTAIAKRSILFLAEGFTAATEQEFHDLCKVLTLKLRKIEPYARLMESLDVFGAFFSSADEGVSIGADMVQASAGAPAYALIPDDSFLPRVLETIGHPSRSSAPVFADLVAFVTAAGGSINTGNRTLWQQTFDVWRQLGVARQSRVRDTAFGLMITYPHHGPYVEKFHPPAISDDTWLDGSAKSRGPARAPFFPDHRLPPLLGSVPVDPATAHRPMLDTLVGKLRTPDGPMRFGERWQTGGDSEGMVVFLCRTDLYGGVSIPGAVLLCTGNQVTVGVANSPIHTTASPAQHLLDVEVGVTSSYERRPLMEMADVLAHELAHSAALGALNDEYGGRMPDASALPAGFHHAKSKANSDTLANVQGVGHSVDASRLKWRWPRAAAGAVVEDCFVSGSDVAFVVNLSHAIRWKRRTGPAPVWVRNGPLWEAIPPVGPIAVNPFELELVAFDPQTQIVRCRPLGGVSAADVVDSFWTQLSVGGAVPDVRIVLQRTDPAGAPQWLIKPAVQAALANGPLTTNACNPLGVFDRTASVTGLRASTPAAYEGGAGLDCLVVRPSRACKLSRRMEDVTVLSFPMIIKRLQAEEFCAVCQYVLTYQLDVSRLPAVDRLL
ncbi:MAG: hypothetical protein IPL61_36395 [Myxococcales bacterium]|nr:hypothetical protein [Myxococcales bacterium]